VADAIYTDSPMGDSMKEEFTGGCACGAIRYNCSEKPVAQLICHCRDCQRASGSATAASVLVASDRITFEGAEQQYHTVILPDMRFASFCALGGQSNVCKAAGRSCR
jgi:hypothetical protein